MIDNEPKLISKRVEPAGYGFRHNVTQTIKEYDDGTITVENSMLPGMVATHRPPKITEIGKNILFVE